MSKYLKNIKKNEAKKKEKGFCFLHRFDLADNASPNHKVNFVQRFQVVMPNHHWIILLEVTRK